MKIAHKLSLILGLGLIASSSGSLWAAAAASSDGDSKGAAAREAEVSSATPMLPAIPQGSIARNAALRAASVGAGAPQAATSSSQSPSTVETRLLISLIKEELQKDSKPKKEPARSTTQIAVGWAQLLPLLAYYHGQTSSYQNKLIPYAAKVLPLVSALSLIKTESQPQGDVSQALALASLGYRLADLAIQRSQKGDVLGMQELQWWLIKTIPYLVAAGAIVPELAKEKNRDALIANVLMKMAQFKELSRGQKAALTVGLGASLGTLVALKNGWRPFASLKLN